MYFMLNKYGEKIVDKFLDKCRADGSYKRVYEDFEDGTCLLEDSVENLFDVCALLYLTYGSSVFATLDEWEYSFNDYAWKLKDNTELSYEEVKMELHKMYS